MALVYGQMNEPPGARARVCLTGLTVAEYFRDAEGQDVLLFIDNIFRFTQAGSEVREGVNQRVSNFYALHTLLTLKYGVKISTRIQKAQLHACIP